MNSLGWSVQPQAGCRAPTRLQKDQPGSVVGSDKGGIWAGQDFDGDTSAGRKGHAEQRGVVWTEAGQAEEW